MAGPAAAAFANGSAACTAVATSAPVVVELYTSEGCSSCPPADRWLSTLKGRSDVLALGFHVSYWDRLGWPDRFASRESTERQHSWARVHGSSSVYTPQVVVNGQDWRRWPALPPGAAAAGAALPLVLSRAGEHVTATLPAGAARALSGYWAALEDQHQSRVRSGENAGQTLRHDHVVRLIQPVPAWRGDTRQQWSLPVSRGAADHPRRVAFVVADALTMKPVQALVLALGEGC